MEKNLFTDVKYLTINEDDRNWGIYVTTLGFQKITSNSPYPPEGHPEGYMFNTRTGRVLKDYQIVYITEGEGYFESEHMIKVKVEKGTVFFLFPNEWHNYYPEKLTGWSTYWIDFEGEYIDKLISNSYFSRESPLLQVNLRATHTTIFIYAITTAKIVHSGY